MRKFLVSFKTPSGAGRFFHLRDDDTLPNEAAILNMEAEMELKHGCQCSVMSISEISASDAPAVYLEA